MFYRFDKSETYAQRGKLRQLYEKITVFKDNKIEVRWRVPYESGVRRADFDKEWGGSRIQDQTNLPPAQLAEMIHFPVTPLYQNRAFLHEKYVVNDLSAEEIGLEIVSATSTVLKHLKLLGIPVRRNGKNTRPKGHLAYGQKIVGRKVEV